MLLNWSLRIVLLFYCIGSFGNVLFGQDSIRYVLHLKDASPKKIWVDCYFPSQADADLIFRFPKMVPGTYKIYDFGRFVTSLTAYTEAGKVVPNHKTDINTWAFEQGEKVAKIQYEVSETWTFKDSLGKDVFRPAGSTFKPDTVFALNFFSICGYVDAFKDLPISLNCIIPDGFYGAGTLPFTGQTGDTVGWKAEDYRALLDAPMLVSRPDTATIRWDDAEVLVAVYDHKKTTTAASLVTELSSLLTAQRKFLGGRLPVNKYAFLIYLDNPKSGMESFGALEHNRSSFYYLPSVEPNWIREQIRDIGAHEFLHIVTPLQLHSEQIHYFDFQHPTMSRHLWLYEGVTEYAAGLVQVRYGLISPEEYLEILNEKIFLANEYNDTLPFTEMSVGCLDKYEDQYQNVYYKGALIGMCLDLLIRKKSEGKMGLQAVIKNLSDDYGPTKPFADSLLFKLITQKSYPEVGVFFQTYVDGSAPLPLDSFLHWAGVEFKSDGTYAAFTLGGFELLYNEETQRIKVGDTDNLDAFGKAVGFQTGDEIVRMNRHSLTGESLETELFQLFSEIKAGEKVRVEIARPLTNGKFKKTVKKAKMILIDYPKDHQVSFSETPDATQKKIREAWLTAPN
jgi:predicted metalloprotease with PDZ domain